VTTKDGQGYTGSVAFEDAEHLSVGPLKGPRKKISLKEVVTATFDIPVNSELFETGAPKVGKGFGLLAAYHDRPIDPVNYTPLKVWTVVIGCQKAKPFTHLRCASFKQFRIYRYIKSRSHHLFERNFFSRPLQWPHTEMFGILKRHRPGIPLAILGGHGSRFKTAEGQDKQPITYPPYQVIHIIVRRKIISNRSRSFS
jgi:hypothetical protein